MRYIPHLAALLVVASGVQADGSLAQVRQAQELLGPEIWSRVVRIENRSPDQLYPGTVYALAFELNGILWFYTTADGTQSLSRHPGRLVADKADFGPLLPFIHPGFLRWESAPDGGAEARSGRPPNGCFIESIALLRGRMAQGAQIDDARLLSYYVQAGGRLRGHTVLQYRSQGGVRVIDPNRPTRVIQIRPRTSDPLAVARWLRNDVSRARAVPLDEIVRPLQNSGTLEPATSEREPVSAGWQNADGPSSKAPLDFSRWKGRHGTGPVPRDGGNAVQAHQGRGT